MLRTKTNTALLTIKTISETGTDWVDKRDVRASILRSRRVLDYIFEALADAMLIESKRGSVRLLKTIDQITVVEIDIALYGSPRYTFETAIHDALVGVTVADALKKNAKVRIA